MALYWDHCFLPYTTPLRAMTSSFDINHHLYADYTQVCISLYQFEKLMNL